jgi:hypothetical protein
MPVMARLMNRLRRRYLRLCLRLRLARAFGLAGFVDLGQLALDDAGRGLPALASKGRSLGDLVRGDVGKLERALPVQNTAAERWLNRSSRSRQPASLNSPTALCG